jgi:hypothetical protein
MTMTAERPTEVQSPPTVVSRSFLDKLGVGAAVAIAIGLVVAAGLLNWGRTFANDQVHDRLDEQNITFPPESEAVEGGALDPEVYPGLQQYAGQKVDSGEKAKAYADEFIGVHLDEVAGGKTYSEISAESRANPDDEELAGQVQTLFRGETLRGLLMTAYAFSVFGEIAGWAMYATLLFALGFAVAALLGWRHLRRMPA